MENLMIENKTIAGKFYHILNNRMFNKLEELWPEKHQFYIASNSIALNKKEHLDFIHKLFLGFPDFNFTILDEISEGDKIFIRGKMDGTHQGDYQGIKKTEKNIQIYWMSSLEILGEKIYTHWFLMDSLSLMKQIGAIPYQLA